MTSLTPKPKRPNPEIGESPPPSFDLGSDLPPIPDVSSSSSSSSSSGGEGLDYFTQVSRPDQSSPEDVYLPDSSISDVPIEGAPFSIEDTPEYLEYTDENDVPVSDVIIVTGTYPTEVPPSHPDPAVDTASNAEEPEDLLVASVRHLTTEIQTLKESLTLDIMAHRSASYGSMILTNVLLLLVLIGTGFLIWGMFFWSR